MLESRDIKDGIMLQSRTALSITPCPFTARVIILPKKMKDLNVTTISPLLRQMMHGKYL